MPPRPRMMPAGREVGALDVAHQALGVDRRVVDERDRRVDHLAQVVRRDVRRHADRDPRGAVDQQVREARRKDQRFAARAVVVGREVDRVHVEVAQHLGRDPREAGLGVAHGGSRVVVDGAEVALAVDELVAHRELLRHADERVVDRGVAVGVILAHHLADDLARTSRRSGSGRGRARSSRTARGGAPASGRRARPAARGRRSPTSRSRDTRCASPPRAPAVRCSRRRSHLLAAI